MKQFCKNIGLLCLEVYQDQSSVEWKIRLLSLTGQLFMLSCFETFRAHTILPELLTLQRECSLMNYLNRCCETLNAPGDRS